MVQPSKVTQQSNSVESTETVDVDGCVALYLELRGKVAELKAELNLKLKPYQKGMQDLDGILLQVLQDQKAQNIKTKSGTVYQRTVRSATIKDKKAFSEFVIENGQYDLLTWMANKVEVFDYMEKNETEVPGLNTSSYMTIGVRTGDTQEKDDE